MKKMNYSIEISFFLKGFKWVRRLNYRGKLTMHTAYERKENPSPAAVTALGISK
jgi:hypothetical protein